MVSGQKFTSAGKCRFMPSVSPSHLHRISSVPVMAQMDILRILGGCSQFYTTDVVVWMLPLRDPRVLQRCDLTTSKHLPSSLGDHCSIIYAEPVAEGNWSYFGWGVGPVRSHPRVDDHRSSVANSLAPLSLHITPIISCRRRLPVEQRRRHLLTFSSLAKLPLRHLR